MRILAIAAHPDDVEIGCYATLKQYKQKGYDLTYLVLTCGGDAGDVIVRKGEQLKAAWELEAKVIFSDLQSAYLSNDSGRATIKAIENAIKEVNPDIIFSHSDHDTHQDHRLVNMATRSACRFFSGELLFYEGHSSLKTFSPNIVYKIDDFFEDKLRVIRFFDSQASRFYMNPKVLEGIAIFRAAQFGFIGKAEAFELGGMVR